MPVAGHELCPSEVARQARIELPELVARQLLPHDAVAAPQAPGARVRLPALLRAVDDEEAVAPDEGVRAGAPGERDQSVQAGAEERFQGPRLLFDPGRGAGERVADEPRRDPRKVAPADRQGAEWVHEIARHLAKRVGP